MSEAITEAPIGEPVLVKGAEGKCCYNPAESAASPGVNLLHAATDDIVCDGTQFCLANEEHGVGFYKVTTGTTLAAGKAYLSIPGNEVKPFYGFDFSDATIIRSIGDKQSTINVYNLLGQKVSNSKLTKGVIILNNKKVVNK